MKALSTLTALAALTLGTGALAQEKVMVGEPSWPGAKVMSRVIGQVIETRLGGEAGYAPGANAVIFAAMDGGRGDIDVHPDVWLPNHESFRKEYVEQKGTVALSSGSYEGRTGFCTPTYMAEEHNIRSIFDLATPMAQDLFDTDGDGKGEIWVGGSGWASTNVHKVKVRDYGIETFLDPSTEDEAVLYARLKDAIVACLTAALESYDRSRAEQWPDPPMGLSSWSIPRETNGVCPRCGGPISTIRVRARGTCFCPKCQK